MSLTPAELAKLQRMSAARPRRRLSARERVRYAWQGLQALGAAWWYAWRGAEPRRMAERHRVARRLLRAAREGRA